MFGCSLLFPFFSVIPCICPFLFVLCSVLYDGPKREKTTSCRTLRLPHTASSRPHSPTHDEPPIPHVVGDLKPFSLCSLSLCMFVAPKVGVSRLLPPTSLFRELVGRPCFSIDTTGPRQCALGALAPTLAVCHRQGTGQSSEARTCSGTWVVFLKCLDILQH